MSPEVQSALQQIALVGVLAPAVALLVFMVHVYIKTTGLFRKNFF